MRKTLAALAAFACLLVAAPSASAFNDPGDDGGHCVVLPYGWVC